MEKEHHGKNLKLILYRYIGGTIVVTIGFLPIFLPFLPEDESDSIKIVYFVFFSSIFGIGWASTQIAHMSLVPSLTCSIQRRDMLNGKRNTFTFVANLLVLGLALFFF